jgi:hypothetical protein
MSVAQLNSCNQWFRARQIGCENSILTADFGILGKLLISEFRDFGISVGNSRQLNHNIPQSHNQQLNYIAGLYGSITI